MTKIALPCAVLLASLTACGRAADRRATTAEVARLDSPPRAVAAPVPVGAPAATYARVDTAATREMQDSVAAHAARQQRR